MIKQDKILNQITRYIAVGLFNNGIGYTLYLTLTHLGLDPKLVAGFSYPIAMLISFYGNKNITFNNTSKNSLIKLRYLISHCCACFLNLFFLYIFVDIFNIPHQVVQLTCIFIISLFLFLMMKFFVFNTNFDKNHKKPSF